MADPAKRAQGLPGAPVVNVPEPQMPEGPEPLSYADTAVQQALGEQQVIQGLQQAGFRDRYLGPVTRTQTVTSRQDIATPTAEAAAEVAGAREGLQQAQQEEIVAVTEAGDQMSAAAEGQGVKRAEYADSLEGQKAERLDAFAGSAPDLDKIRGEIEAEHERVRKGVDPSRIWKMANPQQRIGMVFAHMLAGVGNGLLAASGRAYQPADVIGDMIDMDIEAQKGDIEGAMRAIDSLEGRESGVYRKLESRLQNLQAIGAINREQAATWVEMLGDRSTSAQVQGLARQQSAQLRKQAEQLKLDQAAQRYGTTQVQTSQATQTGGVARNPVLARARQLMVEGQKRQATLENKQQEIAFQQGVETVQHDRAVQLRGYARDPSAPMPDAVAMRGIREKLNQQEDLERLVGRLQDIYRNTNGLTATIDPGIRSEVKQIQEAILFAAKPGGLGVLSESDKASIRSMAGSERNILEAITGGESSTLNATVRRGRAALSDEMGQFGYQKTQVTGRPYVGQNDTGVRTR